MKNRLLAKIRLETILVVLIIVSAISVPMFMKLKNGYIIKEQTEYKLIDSLLKPLDFIYFPLTFLPNKLPKYEIFYSEKDFSILTKGLPKTVGIEELNRQLAGREYINGVFSVNGKRFPVQVAIHGEGLANYNNSKKSLRIKFKEPFQGRMIWNFVVPEQRRFNSVGASEFIAKRLGILSQQWDYAWLRINNDQMGVYEMVDETDTSFLEANRLSPNDLVFREDIRVNVVSGNYSMSVFEPDGSWSLSNQPEIDDPSPYTPIEYFKSVIQLQGSEFYSKIKEIMDMDEFLKWSSILYILNDTHQSNYNNERLIFLKEKGQFWIMPDHIFVQPVTQFVDQPHRHFLNDKILSYPPYFWKRNEIIWSLISDPSFEKDLHTYLDLKINRINAPLYQDSQKAFRYLVFKKMVKDQNKIIDTNIATIRSYFDLYDINSVFAVINRQKDNIIGNIKIGASSFFEPKLDSLSLQFEKIPNGGKINLYYDINDNEYVDSQDVLAISQEVDPASRTQILNINAPLLATRFNTSVYDSIKPVATSTLLIQGESNIAILKDAKLSFSNPLTGEKLRAESEFVNFSTVFEDQLIVPDFLKQTSQSKFIIPSGTYIIDQNTLIPEGELTIDPGTTFKMTPGASIISKASIVALGTPHQPIIFTKSDSNLNWGSLVIINAKKKSMFSYTTVEYGSGYTPLSVTGELAAHFSDLIFDNGNISNSGNDDGINVKHANATITNSHFDKNQSDHIDFDTVTGEVANNIFNNENIDNIDSDGLDVSFSKVTIKNNSFYKSSDKCISVGEESKLEIYKNQMDSCKYAVAVKDGSIATITENIIKNNKIGITTYLKKTLYGVGGTAIISNNTFENNLKDLDEGPNSKIIRQ